MEKPQDVNECLSASQQSIDLRIRTKVLTNRGSPLSCESVTPASRSSFLSPRRLLKISFACNVFCIVIWLGFYLLIELSSLRCQSNLNTTALNMSISTAVVGQTVAVHSLVSILTAYMQNASVNCASGYEAPGLRPLILAVHGGSGTGKTYIVDLLAKHFGKQCSLQFIVPLHFPIKNSKPKNNFYRDQVTTALHVPASLGSCLLRLLALEDVDSTPEGVVSGLVLATLTWSSSYVPTVVVLTSSLGSQLITDYIVTNNHRDLDQTTLNQLLAKATAAANTPWGDAVAKGNLIPHNIYLLPLELRHLRQCIEKKLIERGIWKKDLVQMIINHSSFVETGSTKLAKYGCKTVDSDVVYWSGI